MTLSVITAENESAAARARLGVTLLTLQSRLAPKTLALEAAQGVIAKGQAAAETGVALVRRNPFAVAGALAVAGLFIARKPIAKMLMPGDRATSPAPKSSTVRKPRAVKRKSQ